MATDNEYFGSPELVDGVDATSTVNEIVNWIGAAVLGPILDRDLTAPPTLVNGNAYIVAAGGSGAWAGHDLKIAFGEGGEWKFIVPRNGQQVKIVDEDTRLEWNGSAWAAVAGGGGGGGAPTFGSATTITSVNTAADLAMVLDDTDATHKTVTVNNLTAHKAPTIDGSATVTAIDETNDKVLIEDASAGAGEHRAITVGNLVANRLPQIEDLPVVTSFDDANDLIPIRDVSTNTTYGIRPTHLHSLLSPDIVNRTAITDAAASDTLLIYDASAAGYRKITEADLLKTRIANIDDLTVLAGAFNGAADKVVIWDDSAGAHRSILIEDLLPDGPHDLSSLTQLTAIDQDADRLLVYDNSASTHKYITPEDLLEPGMVELYTSYGSGSQTTSATAANITQWSTAGSEIGGTASTANNKLTLTSPGTWKISYDITFTCQVIAVIAHIYFDGSTTSRTGGQTGRGTSNLVNISGNGTVSFASGSKDVQIYFSGSAGNTFAVKHASFTAEKVTGKQA